VMTALFSTPARAQWRSTLDVGTGLAGPRPGTGRRGSVSMDANYGTENLQFDFRSTSMPTFEGRQLSQLSISEQWQSGTDGWFSRMHARMSSVGASDAHLASRTDVSIGPAWRRGSTLLALYGGVAGLVGRPDSRHATTAGLSLTR